MLFRMVRPMRRDGSRNRYFVRRIPADVRAKIAGQKLTIPLGDGETRTITISPHAQSVRFSLGTDDPATVKARNASVDAHLEQVWRAFREDTPVKLSPEQAEALAGRLYRAWAASERRERTLAVEQGADGRMHVVEHDPAWDDEDIFTAALVRHLRPSLHGKVMDMDHLPPIDEKPEPNSLEVTLGALVDHLLLAEGIRRVLPQSRGLLLVAFWRALRDALEARLRNAQGDYSADPKAERFPAWTSPLTGRSPVIRGGSLTALVDGWWIEAKARNLKPSTHDSYNNTMKALVAFVGHDDAGRLTIDDVRGFKDHRLATINPRSGKTISAKTVKDNDLAGLKAVFKWAVANGKMRTNPAEGVTLKTPKVRRLRSKGFTDAEAKAILKASLNVTRGGEQPETFAAYRWVPWLMAYSGARVGEMAQLRKQDLHREGKLWYITITPEAGTVKTDEARNVVLHAHLIEMGFVDFVKSAPPGHLFLRVAENGDVLGPLQGVKNRLAEFAREVVPDRGVAPNHGWRHRFKPVGTRAGIDRRTLDVISGHALEGRNDADGYHAVELVDQAAALKKFPRYDVR
jgi:integrase